MNVQAWRKPACLATGGVSLLTAGTSFAALHHIVADWSLLSFGESIWRRFPSGHSRKLLIARITDGEQIVTLAAAAMITDSRYAAHAIAAAASELAGKLEDYELQLSA